VGNEILRDLPADERNLVSSKLESVTLKLHDVLHEPGAPIEFGCPRCRDGVIFLKKA
jgi:hypothetical protein